MRPSAMCLQVANFMERLVLNAILAICYGSQRWLGSQGNVDPYRCGWDSFGWGQARRRAAETLVRRRGEERLAAHARSAGYDDVQQYAAEQLAALAHQPTPEELPALSDAELQASLAMCDAGMAEADAGGGQDARQAMLDIGRLLGFTAPE